MKLAIVILTGALAGVLFFLAFLWIAPGLNANQFLQQEIATDNSGDRLPQFPALTAGKSYGQFDYDWILKTPDKEPVDVGQFKGKVIFLNIWATWCGPCITEMPGIYDLIQSADEGVAFLIVSYEEVDTVVQFISDYDFYLSFKEMPIYVSTRSMPGVIRSRVLPTTYIIDKAGIIRYRHAGAAAWGGAATQSFLKALVDEAS